jgi:Arylsulfotransferase (ASST).
MNRKNNYAELSSQVSNYNTKLQVWNFVSAPDLHPMKVTVDVDKSGTESGSIFVAPFTLYEATMIGQTGTLIMDQAGNPIWFNPLCSTYIQNTDFRVQSYHGHPVLTMWQGTISGTQSNILNLPAGDPEPGAYYVILNQHYNTIKRITARKGYTSDLHEFIITKRNTALFTAIKQVPADLTPYGGPENGYIDDYSIQEVDLETGRLLFFWNALSHVNPADSMIPAASASESNNIWDCYHVNSIDEGPGQTLLISMRNMWAIYKIDKKTDNIIWQLGGKQNDFTISPDAAFSWQHDARFRSENLISIFDDACCASSTSPPQCQSHGLILQLDYSNMTAIAVRKYFHDPALYVPSQGNVQMLPNGNQFIGWGQEPYLSEFAEAGNTMAEPALNFLYNMRFPNQNMSYRAFKNKWIGLPLYPPSIAVISVHDNVELYASWNGSTETVAWQVLAGPSTCCMSVIIDHVPRTGFETKIKLKSNEPYYQIKALDSCGFVIGISEPIAT